MKIPLLQKTIFICLVNCFGLLQIHAQSLLAFPGAEGYGAVATGGRGARAVYVTNLNDDGPGSFRAAVSKPNAIVVFAVSGIIHLQSSLEVANNITVAGQTAPGDGIMIYGAKVSIRGQNVILRYLRLRGGNTESPHDSSLNISDAHQVIADHLSIQWGRWDDIQAARSSYVTIQNSIIGESLLPQRFGCLCESDYMTLTHNLWIDNQSRNPKAKGHVQYVNNIVYNWGSSGYIGGHSEKDRYADLIGNYFIKGPSSKDDSFLAMFWPSDHIYQRDNKVDLNLNGKLDGRAVTDDDFRKVTASVALHSVLDLAPEVHIDTPEKALRAIAKNAGDILCRDSVDLRMMKQMLSFGLDGRIVENEPTGDSLPTFHEAQPPKDTDHDGIPDEWEKRHYLNPSDPNDAQRIDPSTHYSFLEEYINEVANHHDKTMFTLLNRPAGCLIQSSLNRIK